jgi:hypothetical protein
MACVGKTSFFFLLPFFCDVNVEVGRELLGLLTAHYFEIDERVFLPTPIPRLVCQQRGSAMIAMCIHWPMRKDHVRLFLFQQGIESFIPNIPQTQPTWFHPLSKEVTSSDQPVRSEVHEW